MLRRDIGHTQKVGKILFYGALLSGMISVPISFYGFMYIICLPILLLGSWGINLYYLKGLVKLYQKWKGNV